MIRQRPGRQSRQLAVELVARTFLGEFGELTLAGKDLDGWLGQLVADEIQQVLGIGSAAFAGNDRDSSRPEYDERSHEQGGDRADLNAKWDAELSGRDWHFRTLQRSRGRCMRSNVFLKHKPCQTFRHWPGARCWARFPRASGHYRPVPRP